MAKKKPTPRKRAAKAAKPSTRKRKVTKAATDPADRKTRKAPPVAKSGGAPRKRSTRTATKGRAPKAKAYVKPKRPVKATPARKPPRTPKRVPLREVKGWQRGPSHHPEAVRSRKRRNASAWAGLTPRQIAARRRAAEARAIADAIAAEREDKRQRRNERARERRKRAADPRAQLRASAERWLEYIRDAIARQFPISLEIAAAAGRGDGGRDAWIAIGRYDFMDPVSYAELGDCFRLLRDDLFLETMIHPERMSQIRVLYHDPTDKRGEGDRYISFLGPWNAVIGEACGDVIDSGDDSLAERYQDTTISTFFVYFSSNLEGAAEDVSPWMPASAVPVSAPSDSKKPNPKKARKR